MAESENKLVSFQQDMQAAPGAPGHGGAGFEQRFLDCRRKHQIL